MRESRAARIYLKYEVPSRVTPSHRNMPPSDYNPLASLNDMEIAHEPKVRTIPMLILLIQKQRDLSFTPHPRITP